MQSDHARNIYRVILHRVMPYDDESVFWNDTDNRFPMSIVGSVQMFSENTDTTFKCSAFLDYPIHVLALIKYTNKREWLINNCCFIVTFQSVSVGDFDVIDDGDDTVSSHTNANGYFLSVTLRDSVRLTSTK